LRLWTQFYLPARDSCIKTQPKSCQTPRCAFRNHQTTQTITSSWESKGPNPPFQGTPLQETRPYYINRVRGRGTLSFPYSICRMFFRLFCIVLIVCPKAACWDAFSALVNHGQMELLSSFHRKSNYLIALFETFESKMLFFL